jgi:putrescine transport system substrate-binding protein
MLKKLMACSTVALLLCSATWVGEGAHATEPKVLNIYNWSDYIAEDTIKNFEKETGIKVRYDTYDRDELLNARLLVGNSGYDVVVPGADFAKSQIESGLLQKLDRKKLTNWGNLEKGLLDKVGKLDPGNEHLVVWLWGYVTVGINVNRVKAALGALPLPENAWSLVFDPKYAGKLKSCGITMLDSAATVVPAALLYAGKPPFSKTVADYAAAADILKSVRPFVRHFSSSGYIDELSGGETCVVIGFSNDINIARSRATAAKAPFTVEALVPKSGAALIFDTMAIPKDAKNVENAHLFINYILRPEVHASLTNHVFSANPNAASLKFVKKEVAENKSVFLDSAAMKTMVPPDALSQSLRRVQTRVFADFKAGR